MSERTVQRLFSRSFAAKKLLQNQKRNCFTDVSQKSMSGVRLIAEAVADRTDIADISQSDTKLKTIDDLPGPRGYPVVGTAPEYFRKANRGQMHEVQRRFHRKYGSMFKEKLGPVTNVSIADPDIVEELVRKEGKYPLRPPYESWVLYRKFRNQKYAGVMSSVGPEWHKMRQSTAKHTLRPKTVAEYTGILNGVSDLFVNRLRFLRNNEGSVAQLSSELSKWALECGTGIILEKNVGCLENEIEPRIADFIEAVGNMFLTGHELMVFPEVHKKLNTKPWRVHVQAWDTIFSVATELIENRITEIQNSLQSGELEKETTTGVLRHLISHTKLNIDEIYVNATELLLGGVDTSSNALGFAMYLLAKNPNAQERLHQEVDTVCNGNPCTSENLQNMPYLKAVLKESLRMYPIIPINARVMQEDTVLNGHVIPKNTCVLLNGYTMGYNEKYFPEPEQFRPERWLRSSENERHPFAMLPFGFGSRMCAGRRIAEQQIFTTLIKTIQSFWMESDGDVETTVRTVITPKHREIPIQFIDR
ncbi:1,25-dihydroxyvitamin D(3) 24-hydroxylase, mitochondrial-like [Ostrea edulis]|uniref:1,25-dihydroxyvitamin D(3) 24-hydroxylase, mitochondrial-like n=1 Tax=Ostrea edulis TaxID=37623 RepID=UPI0024AFCC20|nr:1,25-dihydroxyvitamin D(3) 24-hydroxylase, mitochondrial-like [Ostrea edulis]XP_055997946.1 1,25-dihydroxyvitamin D(3) 24-hydroxylase, mitochondrial-like [Ostrea edulis]